METRANHVFVGAVTLVLLALLAAFIIWIARLNEGTQKQYDIFFRQSVDGLNNGSQVSFSGVPVGQVAKIELWPQDPSLKRVRISVKDNVPVLLGTTATIQGSFTGVSDIQLDGAVKGAPPITALGPEGVPVIPTKQGGLGAILNNAPLLLERLSTLDRPAQPAAVGRKPEVDHRHPRQHRPGFRATSRMRPRSSRRRWRSFRERSTRRRGRSPRSRASPARPTRCWASAGDSLAVQMRDTLASAKAAADELQGTLADTRPALKEVSQTTLPAAETAIRDLRATSRALRNVTEKIDEQGAAALLKGPKLPDYKP